MKLLLFVLILSCSTLINATAKDDLKGGILSSKVNGSDEDYNAWVIFGDKEDTLFFTSSRPVPNRRPIAISAEIFYTTRPTSMRNMSTPWNEGWTDSKQIVTNASRIAQFTRGSQAISGDRIIFAAERDMSTNTASGTSYLFDLWQMTKRIDGYSFPEPLTNVNDPEAWDSQPALSLDGKVLVFVTNRADGKGSLDLWYSVLDGQGVWSKPVPVPDINTQGDEFSPHFGADGKFYFSTNWDYKKNEKGKTGKDIYRADFKNVGGIQLPENPIILDDAIADDAAKYGLSIPKNLRYNSDADDEFPFITPDRSAIFITSNRKGEFNKRNLFAYSLPKSKIRIQVDVEERILDSRGNELVPPTIKNGLSMTLSESGSKSNVNITSGSEYEVEANKNYDIKFSKFVNEECYSNKVEGPDGLTINTVRPFSMDTLFHRKVLISRQKVEIPPIVFQSTDTLPYFVTGYWYPNTTTNLIEYRKREANGFFNRTGFVDSTGHDYTGASKKIDQNFSEQIYKPLIKLLPSFQEFCRDTLYLKVTVHGYTDPRGLSGGEDHPYRSSSKNKHDYPDETITVGVDERGQPVSIPTGIDMWKHGWPSDPNEPKGKWVSLQDEGQNGNIILSKLRAYYTFVTFDIEMKKLSPIYSQMRDQGRVILDAEGFGIDKSGFEQRRLRDDPQSRRIEIYLDIVRPEEIKYHRRLPGGEVKEAPIKLMSIESSEQIKSEENKISKASESPTAIPEVQKPEFNEEKKASKVVTIEANQKEHISISEVQKENILQESPPPLPPSKDEPKPVDIKMCYAILFNSYKDKSEVDKALNAIQKSGLSEASISEYYDSFGNVNYRLKYGCYKTQEEAVRGIKDYTWVSQKLNLNKKPIIIRE